MEKNKLIRNNSKRKERAPTPQSSIFKSNPTATTDRLKIEKQLRKNGPTSTVYFRDVLSIPAPAARIFELRHYGKRLNIQKTMKKDVDASGKTHSFAYYYLLPGKYENNATGESS